LSGSSLEWQSDLDGVLGTGTNVSTVDLSTGTHIITLVATDSNTLSDQDQVTIHVLAGDAPEPTNLDLAPSGIAVVSELDGPAEVISMTVRSSSETPLDWTAAKDASWLSLSASAGTTPSDLQVTVDPAALSTDVYTDTITITAAGAENSPFEIPVSLEILAPTTKFIYLPTLFR
jgi:hypothetical protein